MQLKWRILQIDLARQKETVSYVKSYADFAAAHGYNALMLYLENAVRTPSTPFFSEEETYSEEEISEIVSYCGQKGIEVIPALENLGHLEKFFLYPELAPLSELYRNHAAGRGFDPFPLGSCGCVSEPEFNKFFDNYLTEVISLFRGKYVHMGLDEPFDFAVCKKCQARLKAGESKRELFLRQILHSRALCRSLGKTMMMWDDFFEYADVLSELPRDIILCNWNYVFIGDEPAGHWTNRIRRDWFRLYDELGFSYLFCTYAHRASSAYNVETFTAYAEKYHPIGAIMTAWKRSDSFYLGAYPVIAYAGALWSGASYGDRTEVYASVLGSRRAAELLSAANLVECPCRFPVDKVCEGDNMIKLVYREAVLPLAAKLRALARGAKGEGKDILTDIANYVTEIEVGLRLAKLSERLFDCRERGIPPQGLLPELDEIDSLVRHVKRQATALWKKYRGGIASCRNGFSEKFKRYRREIRAARAACAQTQKTGILYADLMLYDAYPTVRGEVAIGYADGTRETVYKGSLKPTFALFDAGGCYTYRFAVKDVPPAYAEFTVTGEGAHYAAHFRCVAQGRKYLPCGVEIISGKVEQAENLLHDDTRAAKLGEEDGLKHFENIALSKERHTVRVRLSAGGMTP